jgi:hypothetical protein
MARANADVYGVAGNVRAAAADVRDAGLAGVDAVFIDPARRRGGRRMPAGKSEPPLPWCVALADRVGAVGIKAAPGLAHNEVPTGWELEFIAVAKNYLRVTDFERILDRVIGPAKGQGRIGGKAAGMFLGYRILQGESDDSKRAQRHLHCAVVMRRWDTARTVVG